MAARRTQQGSTAWLVAGVAAGAAGVAVWQHWPGVAALWLGLVVAAWTETPAPLTRTNAAGRATLLDPRQSRRRKRFAVWSACRTTLMNPVEWVRPRWVTVSAALTGAAAWTLPVLLPATGVGRLVNAVSAAAIVCGVAAARRRAAGSPAVAFSAAAAAWRAARVRLAVAGTLGFLLAATVFITVTVELPSRQAAWPQTYRFLPVPLALALGGLLGWVVVGVAVRPIALRHWRVVAAARSEWQPRWEAAALDPAPQLDDVQRVGQAAVYDFTASRGAAEVLRLAPRVSALLGGGVTVGFLTVPDEDGAARPVEGTVHPSRLQVALWPGPLPDPFTDLDEPVRVMAARTAWQLRWATLKVDPAPVLVASRPVPGPDGTVAVVDTFVAGHQGAAAFWPLTGRVAPMVPGHAVHVLPVADGHGSRSTTRFETVTWGAAGLPDVSGPDIDADVALLALRCAAAATCEAARLPAPQVTGLRRVTPEGHAGAWLARCVFPDGGSLRALRVGGDGAGVAAMVGGDSVIDHRTGGGLWFVGDLSGPFLDGPAVGVDPSVDMVLGRCRDEDLWHAVWSNVLRPGQCQPTVQHWTGEQTRMVGQATVKRWVHGVPQGLDVSAYFGLEQKLATALTPAPFLAVTGWTEQVPGRAGERHPQLVCVLHSPLPVPANPSLLEPDPGAPWVVAGHVNDAFRAARLAQPEVTGTRCLTAPRDVGPPGAPSRRGGHIWQVRLRLYGGVTLADVRAASHRLRTSLGVDWLRVAAGEDGATFYMGAQPADCDAVDPGDALLLVSLGWEQAFLDSGVTGSGGLLPRLVGSDRLASNRKVRVLDFDLPAGVDVAAIHRALPKLRTATGNEFLAVRPGARGAASRILLACPHDPMPTVAPYDYGAAAASDAVPFATGVDGQPVVFDWSESAHLGVFGMTGGGKSVAVASLLVGAVLRGAECVVVDASKGAADFGFARPWLSCIAVTVEEASATVRAVYSEVARRRDLNARHGCESYRRLPADVQPRHLFLVIDEFTSLLGAEPVTRTPFDDPDLEAERQATLARNEARAQVGAFVGKIAREARSAGVTLVLATQKLTNRTLDGIPAAADVKTNLARLLLGQSTYGDRVAALRRPDDAPQLGELVPRGRGIFEASTSAPVGVQVWFDTPQNLATGLARVQPAPVTIDPEPFRRPTRGARPAVEPVDLDQLMGGASRQPPLELDLTVDDLMDSADSVVTSPDSSGTSSGLDEWNAFPAQGTQAAPGGLAAGSPGRQSPVCWAPATNQPSSHTSADDDSAVVPVRAARRPPRWEMPPGG